MLERELASSDLRAANFSVLVTPCEKSSMCEDGSLEATTSFDSKTCQSPFAGKEHDHFCIGARAFRHRAPEVLSGMCLKPPKAMRFGLWMFGDMACQVSNEASCSKSRSLLKIQLSLILVWQAIALDRQSSRAWPARKYSCRSFVGQVCTLALGQATSAA